MGRNASHALCDHLTLRPWRSQEQMRPVFLHLSQGVFVSRSPSSQKLLPQAQNLHLFLGSCRGSVPLLPFVRACLTGASVIRSSSDSGDGEGEGRSASLDTDLVSENGDGLRPRAWWARPGPSGATEFRELCTIRRMRSGARSFPDCGPFRAAALPLPWNAVRLGHGASIGDSSRPTGSQEVTMAGNNTL